jgi:DNA-binding NarL/FixJ family response regulator
MAEVRVLVADDSAVVRAGVRALLDLETAIEVVETVGSLDELTDAVNRVFVEPGDSDIVITDIGMPPTSTDEGIVAAEQLRRTHPWVGVIVLSQFADPTYLTRLIRDGAAGRGYLLKDHIPEPGELVTAIDLVSSGGSFVDRLVADLLVERRVRESASPLTSLTARELDVLAGLATGRSNVAIADMLFIGHRAVEKHISSIFTKLGLFDDPDANRRVRAVLTYLEAGLVPGSP